MALSARDRAFWASHSGISAAPPARRDVAGQVLIDSSSLTAVEVAERLHVSVSTVRRRAVARKLYSYRLDRRLAFPDWQFTEAGDQTLPALDRVLSILPDDLHRQAVEGFFRTPMPDLVINGEGTPVAQWLEKGGAVEPVLAIARALDVGF
jgi:hypothetical protein